MRLVRRAAAADDGVLAVLRGVPSTGTVTLRLAVTSRRSQASMGELLRSTAAATHCRIALAETTCITVRWVDGFVSGTAEDLAAFLATVRPQLVRLRGEVSLAAAA